MITPILLCGGSGTRLWPLSRKSYPKQFSKRLVGGGKSLFQASALRFDGPGFANPLVLTGADFRFIVTEQLGDIGINPGAILIEPSARSTAPAVLAAAIWLEQTAAPEELMLIAPSDQVVPDVNSFRAAVTVGTKAACKGHLVTFGIRPDKPETAYGYLELENGADSVSGVAVPLKRFVEKPDKRTAKNMLMSGKFLWNAGIFLFSVRTVLDAFRQHCPDLVVPVKRAVKQGTTELGFLHLEPKAWAMAKNISIDYAVMERSDNLAVVPYDGHWSDLGSWDAVLRETAPDANGVVEHGHATAIDCKCSLLRSEDSQMEVVGVGLENVITVAMSDAVLVADARRSQDVEAAVAKLKEKGARQAEAFPKDQRHWGWFENLVSSHLFQVKCIHILPGATLPLQSHLHRSKHWIIVEGTAKVAVDDEVKIVTENQSVHVPLGAVHRMENLGKDPVVLIEVQTGSHLNEDDVIRHEEYV